jgi:SPP1 gp7 family putative phage head morphogenesis protein
VAVKPTPRARPVPTQQQQRQAARRRFHRARKAEIAYGRKLRQVAKQVGVIVRGMAPKGVVKDPRPIQAALDKYADLLKPWARATAESMAAEVAKRDANAWGEVGKEMGRLLRQEIATAPTGSVMKALLDEQVVLITSIPTVAGRRVHKLTTEALVDGTRAKEVAKEIMRSGQVSESHAMLIARTETGRTTSALTQARALHIGSEGYIWRTAMDADVRLEHKKLEGTFHRWDAPPIAGENGERSHPGAIYNCRCFPEPVLPDRV